MMQRSEAEASQQNEPRGNASVLKRFVMFFHKKYFYYSLPGLSVWPLWIIGLNTLPSEPMTEWWDVPFAISLLFTWVVISVYGINKGLDET